MTNPILIELTRGSLVESVHRGSVAIADADGTLRFALGDMDRLVYPRSALKPVQALPLVESGAAAAFGLADAEIALACASHSGEPMHTEIVAAWLARIGCSEADLACGAQPPNHAPTRKAMLLSGKKPSRIHNNCSGKHTGFLTLARHLGAPVAGYEKVDHPVQRKVARTLAEMAGVGEPLAWGVDGCAAPNFALTLPALAHAFAKLADPDSLTEARRVAAKRIVTAMIANPELVSGNGRACAALTRAAGGRATVKTGAEGFYMAIVPESGLGIALKIDDGATRAAETTVATVLDRLGVLGHSPEARAILNAPVLNTNGQPVGERRPGPALAEARMG